VLCAVPRGPVADVCWENAGDCPAWKANSANRASPDFPFYRDPEAFGEITAYTPTCFDARVATAALVTAGTKTSVTPVVDYSTLQGVRCYSPSLMTGIANCTELTFEDAQAYCLNYVDSNGVSDYRLPLTSLEAGRMCNNGCGYDTASPTWETDPANGLPTTVAGVWVNPEYMGALPPHAHLPSVASCFFPQSMPPRLLFPERF
jgi:hypothetical protein